MREQVRSFNVWALTSFVASSALPYPIGHRQSSTSCPRLPWRRKCCEVPAGDSHTSEVDADALAHTRPPRPGAFRHTTPVGPGTDASVGTGRARFVLRIGPCARTLLHAHSVVGRLV